MSNKNKYKYKNRLPSVMRLIALDEHAKRDGSAVHNVQKRLNAEKS